MIDLMIYCAGLVGVVVIGSFLVEMVENSKKDSWRHKVTAEDIEQLRRLFDEEGSFVAYNEKGEKLLVGYSKE